MARKLEDIGLTNSAKQMHETFMQRLDLTDASDDCLYISPVVMTVLINTMALTKEMSP